MRKPPPPGPLDRTLAAALDRAIRAQKRALRRFHIADADADDIHQDIFLRLLRAFAVERPSNLEAYVRTALEHAALDFLRAQRRRRTTTMEADDFARALDEEGARRSVEAVPAMDREAAWVLLEGDVEAFAAKADVGRHRRGHQVRAWWRVRIEGDDAAEVGRALGAESVDTAWQWCRRGGVLVEALAREDDDRERAARMLAAVGVARRAA